MPKQTRINLRRLVLAKGGRDGKRYTYESIAAATGLSMSSVANLMTNKNSRVDLPIIDQVLDWLNEDIEDTSLEVGWGDLMIRETIEAEDTEFPESKTPLLATA